MRKAQLAGVVAVTSGALLVVSLLLNWWGLPDALFDPPADAPEEIKFMAEEASPRRPAAIPSGRAAGEMRAIATRTTDAVSGERAGGRSLGLDFELPLTRKMGAWIALLAAAGVVVGAAGALRGRRTL